MRPLGGADAEPPTVRGQLPIREVVPSSPLSTSSLSTSPLSDGPREADTSAAGLECVVHLANLRQPDASIRASVSVAGREWLSLTRRSEDVLVGAVYSVREDARDAAWLLVRVESDLHAHRFAKLALTPSSLEEGVAHITFEMSPGGALEFTVSDANGVAASDCAVWLNLERALDPRAADERSAVATRSGVTDRTGRVQIHGLELGEWSFRIEASKWWDSLEPRLAIVTSAAAPPEHLVLPRLPETEYFEGRLTLPTEVAWACLRVRILGPDGEPYGDFLRCYEDGSYYMELEAGDSVRAFVEDTCSGRRSEVYTLHGGTQGVRTFVEWER